ncbi:MAG TPA: GGDEF domain-containing protein [Chromatiaceae bacterium]|nr:GGDEF domain-containing protein [Chromatiaceae bacterium]HIN83059.1 GGDEF domain-containing protein [Chromatiales bacterium]HIA08417.1 GGDEF domain-containing protein [Chromatiaceae bacterium]HIB84055.1 GGDEF domain-containing protein [Chromatiaceae bacterium]HIO13756.1 GGDEF domain-containing protein [Chromatiales bacterium]
MQTTCPLESIIQLTQAEDEQTLSSGLIDVLEALLPKQSVSLFRLNPNNELEVTTVADDQTSSNCNLLPESDFDGLSACRESGEIAFMTLANGQSRKIFPVLRGGTPWGYLLCEGDTIPEDHFDLVKPLIRIFGNQAFMLDQNEHDALTGLLNRQALDNFAKRFEPSDHERRASDATPCCLALLDIDHFKQVNDNFGHLYGDEVLLLFARLMRDSFRHNDLIFRYGGEEFLLVLHDTSLDVAAMVLDRFRKRVEDYQFPQVGQKTISIGITELQHDVYFSETMDQADKALYFSKNTGRNRVNVYEDLLDKGVIDIAEKTKDVDLF